MSRVPADMTPGSRHQTNRCGVAVVVEYLNKKHVTVEFEATRYRVRTTTTSLRTGQVGDKSLRPRGMQTGSRHLTYNYGAIVIVDYQSYYDITIEFEDTGCRMKTNGVNIRSGQIRDKSRPRRRRKPAEVAPPSKGSAVAKYGARRAEKRPSRNSCGIAAERGAVRAAKN